MTLGECLARAAVTVDRIHRPEQPFTGFADHTRDVREGSAFVAMPSTRTETHKFLPDAQKAGAVAAVVTTEAGYDHAVSLGLSAILIRPRGHRLFSALGRLARASFAVDPCASVRIIGITGTNGKTTTAWILRDALTALGGSAAYLGTLGFDLPGLNTDHDNTTPFPISLWNMLGQAQRAGCTDLVMEVSSHALHQRRVAGVSFAAGVFTNLTQDHLDYHHTMEEYLAAKQLLFTECATASHQPFVGVIRTGDPAGAQLLRECTCPATTYGQKNDDFWIEIDDVQLDSIHGRIRGDTPFRAAIGGRFNVANLEAAAATLDALGYPDAEIVHGIEAMTPVPGRFEPIANGSGIGAIVDYAHTPDALEKLLEAARSIPHKRIITVFGCGGDRDATKRPKMAAVASRLSDITIATSDNPRTEDPSAILKDVEAGMVSGAKYEAIVEREAAIARAIELAHAGDLVVVAGKGHETYQIIGHKKFPMDDRDLIRRGLQKRGS